MTVLVGILCSDGVVIGTDSAVASAPLPGHIVMESQDTGALKIELVSSDAITASTGSVGLSQRFNEQAKSIFQALKAPYQPPQPLMGPMGPMGIIGTPIQQVLAGQVQPGQRPIDSLTPVAVGRIISQLVINDFRSTASAIQNLPNHGWGLGALLAFVKGDTPHLTEFDAAQFQPELKGDPDPARGGRVRVHPAVTMGVTQPMSDPFLAFAYRVLFGTSIPTLERAKLAVAWTIDHAIKYNPGGVGGQMQLAVLEKINDVWTAHHSDPGEAQQQVGKLEEYIGEFRHKQQPDVAAEASKVDVHKVLSGEEPIGGAPGQ